ncbi:hypothetical protein [Leptospira kemamanensis]|nr:hypothetical protein [Leptospira kemamanensis]
MQNWLKVVLEAGREALAGSSKKETKDHQKLIAKYEKELEKKNRIIAELSGEILNLKKDLGEL